jgi:hypothetical protein
MTVVFDEDKLQQQIIDASTMEPVDGARPAVMMQFEDKKDIVSIEVIPHLDEFGAVLVLSNNFNIEKHYQYFMRLRVFLETRLGITGFNIFDSHGAPVNGYEIERYYITSKNNPKLTQQWKEEMKMLGQEIV